jgi:hypothetical protein
LFQRVAKQRVIIRNYDMKGSHLALSCASPLETETRAPRDRALSNKEP